MKLGSRLILGAIAAAAVAGLPAPGQARASMVVSYSTSGAFPANGNAPSIDIASGNAAFRITFTGASVSNLAVPDAAAPFGSFEVRNIDVGSTNVGASGTFDLLLTQTAPVAGSGTFTSSLSGSIQFGSSRQVVVTFDSPPDPITLGGIRYTLQPTLALSSPANVLGATTTTALTANIGVQDPPVAVPEPSTLASGGIAAALGLAAAWRRRRGARPAA